MKIEWGELHDEEGKHVKIELTSEGDAERELMFMLTQMPGYMEYLRTRVEGVLDEVADPPTGPEDF